jgi:hypothetical protein
MSFPDLPDIPSFGRRPRKPSRDRPVIFATGPRIYEGGKKAGFIGGPGEPPIDFRTAHNSKDEWDFYWAMSRVVPSKTPRDPRQPPYLGGEEWQYQVPESPTELGLGVGRVPGGSVSDFVYFGGNETAIVIRIQTERYHVFTNSMTQMRDMFIKEHLRGIEKIIDVYSSDWIADESGSAVCKIAALAIQGIELPSPIRYRTAIRTRRPR